jgi:DNA-binding XRE family transcriptional regulator
LWRLRHNTAGQPVVVRIVEIEPRLQAGGAARRGTEGRHCFAQLVGFGPVLRVIDHQIVAAREGQRVVGSLSLRCLFDSPKPEAYRLQNPSQSPKNGSRSSSPRHRVAKGQTQAEAAADLRISPPNYNQWEVGRREPRARQWPAIIHYLGYDPICREPADLRQGIEFLQRHLGLTLAELGSIVGADRHTLAAAEIADRRVRKGLEARISQLVNKVTATR